MLFVPYLLYRREGKASVSSEASSLSGCVCFCLPVCMHTVCVCSACRGHKVLDLGYLQLVVSLS